jgi:hypothetical protein
MPNVCYLGLTPAHLLANSGPYGSAQRLLADSLSQKIRLPFMNSNPLRFFPCFLITLCLSLFATTQLQAISPHAGTYYGSYKFYNGTTPTGVPYSISQIEFTIENDGTISNVIGGVTNTLGTIQGTVTDPGLATFTVQGAAFTSGTVTNGVLTASAAIAAFPGHPATNQALSATRFYGLIPTWQTSTSAASLLPSGNYGLTFAASPSKFVALVSAIASTDGWSTLISTDGINWTKTSLDLQIGAQNRVYASPIAYLNDRFIFSLSGDNLGGPTVHIYSSFDGISWTMTDTGLSTRLVQTWNYFNGNYVGALQLNNTDSLLAITSPDASVWTLRTLASSGVTRAPGTFASSPSRAIIGLSSNVSGAFGIFSGTDVTSPWSGATFPDDGFYAPSAMVYGGNTFMGSGSRVMLSNDGLSWTAAVPGPPVTTDDINFYAPLYGGIYVNGQFHSCSNISWGTLLRSADGQSWNRVARPPAAASFQTEGQNLTVVNGVAVTSAYIGGIQSGRSVVYATLDTGNGLPSVRAPFVTLEPLDTSKFAGTGFGLSANFKLNGLHTTYQWFKDGQPLAGKTAISFYISSSVVGDTGSYTCVATNGVGSTSTRAAAVVITLPPAPTFNSYPSSQNVPEGNNGATFSLSVSANNSPTYQWRLNGVNLSGKTTATLTLTSVPASSGSYDCVLTNAGGVATHPPAVITFLPATGPVVSAPPQFLTYDPAATATLSAGVSGGLSPYTYQWYKDGVLVANGTGVSGATAASLVLTPAQAGSFRCQVTASNGVILGPPTVISLATPPTPNLLGKPFVKIVDQNTFRPDAPTVKLGTITNIRFREDTALIVSQAASGDSYLYRWKDGALTSIATNNVTGPNSLPFVGIAPATSPTEPSSGSFFFVGYHTVATVKTATLYRWFNGTLTAILSQSEATPDGAGIVKSFSSMAAHDDMLFFTVLLPLPDNTPEYRISRRGADGITALLIGPATVLPGTASPFYYSNGQFSYDGTSLLMPLKDKALVGALFRRTNDGVLTRLYDTNTPIPLAGAKYSTPGVGDVEGGRIFAASANSFEVTLNADGTFLSGGTVNARSVTACGPDSYLSFTGGSVYFRQNALALPVITPGQIVDGFTPNTIIAEAHGTEAAILASNGVNTSILVALDKPAEAIPLITYQPVSRTLDSGATTTFTALASGEGLTWQWLKDDAPISGATYNTLTVANLSAADVAAYKAVATNSFGSATSNPATLALLDTSSHAPSFTIQPADQQYAVGYPLTLPYTADAGASTATYLWTKNGIPFSTAATIGFNPSTADNAGAYQLTITNAFGPATSRVVTVSTYDTKSTPVLTWPAPAPIPYGTALSATQLNATAGAVPGTFAYSPAAGTQLGVGANQTLSVTFTPTDAVTYNSVTTTTTLTVTAVSPFLTTLISAGIPANQREPHDDPDADGISNLMEYALGLTPATANASALPVAQPLNGNLTFTYTRARADVTYAVETTTDLTSVWTTTGVIQGTPDPNGLTTASVPIDVPGRYLRLRVTLTP